MKFHLLYHLVKGVGRREDISILDKSLCEQFSLHVEKAELVSARR